MNVMGAAALLGLDPAHFTAHDVDKAFRKAALRDHPDKGGSAAAFARVTQAAETLRDSLKGPEDYGLEMLVDSLGRALNCVRVTAHEVQAVMTVRVFCAGLAKMQADDREFRIDVRNGVVVASCQVTGSVLAEGVGFTPSAVRFFQEVTDPVADVEISFSDYGVDVSSSSVFRFRAISAKEIAFLF
jgi:hypothetical protein